MIAYVRVGRRPDVIHIFRDCWHFEVFAPPRLATTEEQHLRPCEDCWHRAQQGQ